MKKSSGELPVLKDLLVRPFPERVRLKKDLPYISRYAIPNEYVNPNDPFPEYYNIGVWVVRAREEGKLYVPADHYIFPSRKNEFNFGETDIAPRFPRIVLAMLPDFVEVMK